MLGRQGRRIPQEAGEDRLAWEAGKEDCSGGKEGGTLRRQGRRLAWEGGKERLAWEAGKERLAWEAGQEDCS